MSAKTKYTRKFLKKVIRKIAYRGKMSIKEARAFLDYKPNFKNIKHVLNCWRIVPFTKDYFDQGSADVYFIKIGEVVYVLVMNPVFTFTEVYSTKFTHFLAAWFEQMPVDVQKPVKSKFPFTITDRRSKISVNVKLLMLRYMEITDEHKRYVNRWLSIEKSSLSDWIESI